jgi:pimeloyl-ACP methyl ester carboxylesterase
MEKDISIMRIKVTALVCAIVLPILVISLAPDNKRHTVAPNQLLVLPEIFVLDEQSTLEYWSWQREDILPAHPVTWVMPGIGGPGSILDNDMATDLINTIKSPDVDQIIIIQLRGHSLHSELACKLEWEFDDCIKAHQNNGLDLTKYHYLQYAQDAIQLRKHLGIKKWHVWGASYGGRVATAMAMLDPDAMSSLLLDSAIAFAPEDRPSGFATSSELLHKLYAACETFDNCFKEEQKTLSQLEQFIEDFETPTHRINGFDYISIHKAEWIYTLNALMYDYSFELAIEWIFLHIENPDGFSFQDLSDEFISVFSHYEAEWYSEENGAWSINYSVTECNEDPSKNTFKVTDYGVYGQELDMADYCWPLKDWSQTELTQPDIPVMIVHLPFDNVITYQDGESYLQYWPHAQWCTIEEMGHTMPSEYADEMIEHISRNQAWLPSFCLPREPKLYNAVATKA